jgi:hypothetical protein
MSKLWNEIEKRFDCIFKHMMLDADTKILLGSVCTVIEERFEKLEAQADHPAAFLLKPENEDIARDIVDDLKIASRFHAALQEASAEAHRMRLCIERKASEIETIEHLGDCQYYLERAFRLLTEINRRKENGDD